MKNLVLSLLILCAFCIRIDAMDIESQSELPTPTDIDAILEDTLAQFSKEDTIKQELLDVTKGKRSPNIPLQSTNTFPIVEALSFHLVF